MRTTVIALVAIALMSPTAALAAPERTMDPASSRVTLKKAKGLDSAERKKPRKYAARKSAKSKPYSKQPKIARAAPTIDKSEPGRGGLMSTLPPCSSNQSLESSRRCLRLVEPGPAPTLATASRPSAAVYHPAAPFAAPSRSWLGAFSKRIVAEIVEITETMYADRDSNWRTIMSMEVQRELEQTRLKETEKPKQPVGQAPAKDAPSGPQRRRANGA